MAAHPRGAHIHRGGFEDHCEPGGIGRIQPQDGQRGVPSGISLEQLGQIMGGAYVGDRTIFTSERRGRESHRSIRRVRRIEGGSAMIRKLRSGRYRLYSRKMDKKTGKRRNLGTFRTRADAERHERAIQFFKRR
jgi:hypothetical protein